MGSLNAQTSAKRLIWKEFRLWLLTEPHNLPHSGQMQGRLRLAAKLEHQSYLAL
jgi:hypothetical protein